MESGICVIVSRLKWEVEWLEGKPIVRDIRRICLHDPQQPHKCTRYCRVDERTMTVSDYLDQEKNRSEIFNPQSDILSARCFEPLVPVLEEESFAEIQRRIGEIVSKGPPAKGNVPKRTNTCINPNLN